MSLAFIGRAAATKRNCAEIFTALSITRLEGSRWWFAADAVVMEKVRKCGLMWSREETLQVRKVCGETECVETVHPFWGVVVGKPDSMMKGLWAEETRRHRRAGTRHDNFDLECLLRGIWKTFRNESPVDLSRSESLDNHHGCLTDGT